VGDDYLGPAGDDVAAARQPHIVLKLDPALGGVGVKETTLADHDVAAQKDAPRDQHPDVLLDETAAAHSAEHSPVGPAAEDRAGHGGIGASAVRTAPCHRKRPGPRRR